MQVFRGLPPPAQRSACALTIGNFDGVHRGHQAMLSMLVHEARQRGLPSTVLTFEPHPRDFFARRGGRPEAAPARVSTLRDGVAALADCGVDRLVVLRFDAALAGLSASDFVQRVLLDGLCSRLVMVGDDFRFGAGRQGDYGLLDAEGGKRGFDVARMMSFEVHGLRVSSSAVRAALSAGDMEQATALLGRPYAITARAAHGRKLGRELGFPTLNLRFPHARPAASGIFVARVFGLVEDAGQAVPAVASFGVRPTVEDAGRVLLEVHCLQWPQALGPEGGYGRCLRVELLHKLHDELKYDSLDALREGIAADVQAARTWFEALGL